MKEIQYNQPHASYYLSVGHQRDEDLKPSSKPPSQQQMLPAKEALLWLAKRKLTTNWERTAVEAFEK